MRALIALTVALAALTACSAEDKKPAANAVPSYTTADASKALIVQSDLPSSYSQNLGYRHDELPPGCPAVDEFRGADAALVPTFAVISFRNPETTGSVDHEVEVYPSAKDADTQFDALIAALKTCKSWDFNFGGMSATLSLTPTRPGVIGQRSAVLNLAVDSRDTKVRGQEVLAVSGNALVSLAESGPLGASDDPRIDLLTLATKLVQRLRAQVA